MPAGRWLLLLGSLVGLAGSFGLFFYGPSVVGVFDVLTQKVGQAPSVVFAKVPYAAIAALAFGLGATLAAGGLRAAAKRQAISATGRVLVVLAGVAGGLAGAAVLLGAASTFRDFYLLASAGVAPQSADVDGMVAAGVKLLALGFASLAAAQWLVLLAGLTGFGRDPAKPGRSCLTAGTLGFAVLGSLGFAGLFLMIFVSAGREQALVAASEITPKPSEMAGHLVAILRNLLAAGACLGLYGLATILAGLLLPGRQNA